MRKPSMIGLSALLIVVCFIGGNLFAQLLIYADAKKPETGSYNFELRYMDGTLVTSYDWGEFVRSTEKEFDCMLVYLGDTKAKVTWNVIDLPVGLELEIWDTSGDKPKQWHQDNTITFKPEDSRSIKILLRNVDAEPGQQLYFVLRFSSMNSGG
ncbi:MAG: hypothetical protein ACFFCP_06030 [Promethearchaeota archaeon]